MPGPRSLHGPRRFQSRVDQLAYILDTFPVIERSERREHGEYRTKRVVLEICDALAAAAARGLPYDSPLGPPRKVT